MDERAGQYGRKATNIENMNVYIDREADKVYDDMGSAIDPTTFPCEEGYKISKWVNGTMVDLTDNWRTQIKEEILVQNTKALAHKYNQY